MARGTDARTVYETQGLAAVILYRLAFANGKSYIGITVRTAQVRYREHELDARNGPAALYRAWRKYGAPALLVLGHYATKEELRLAEVATIAECRTLSPLGYNMTPGGDSNPMDVPEIARRAGDKNIGRVHTIEARRNMGLARRGNPLSEQHRRNIGQGQQGRVHAESTREKIRARAIGRKPTAEQRAKYSAQRKGVVKGPMSEETKRKLSEVRRSYWQRMRTENPEQLQAIIAKSAKGIERAWARRKGV